MGKGLAGAYTGCVRWFTGAQRNLRSFAIMRIVLGTAILWFLITSAKDRHYMWGQGSVWIDPAVEIRNYPWFFHIFPKDDPLRFDVLYGLLVVVTLTFIAGAFTRWTTVVLTLLWVGLSVNSVLLTNGGDVVTRIALFFAIFANLGAHWSVDAWRARRRGSPTQRRSTLVPAEITNAIHNTALVILCWQVILIYVNSGLFKLQGSEWREGTALYYALNLDIFLPFPTLSELAWQVPSFVFVGSMVGIWVQLLFPVFLLWKPARYVSLALLVGMHFGIGLFFGLWPFSMAMMALDVLFVRDSSWERIPKLWHRAVTFLAVRRSSSLVGAEE